MPFQGNNMILLIKKSSHPKMISHKTNAVNIVNVVKITELNTLNA